MKRNMDLAQKILESVAECQDPAGISSAHLLQSLTGTGNIVQAAHDDRYFDLIHHLDLLLNAGFLSFHGRDPNNVELEGVGEPTLYRMTWAGHDLLDSLLQLGDSAAVV